MVYFDPGSEKFELFPTPKVEEGAIDIMVALGVIEGCVSIALHDICSIKVLAMKEYRVAESWVTLYTISHYDLCFRPFSHYSRITFYSLKNNVLILNLGHGDICAVDMKTKEAETVSIKIGDEEYEDIIDTCFYVESLASPHVYAWIDEQHKQFSKKIKWIGPNLRKRMKKRRDDNMR
ncbi:unnamed protein product [Cuscuta epithymum]|nr:unnamed protein product [Cuscuta epithymum]